MKSLVGMASVALAAALPFVLPADPGNRAEEMVVSAIAGPRDYSLRRPGRAAECALGRGVSSGQGLSMLAPAPACARVHPAMARVRYWSEEADGSVAFLSADGETLIRFAVADGPGYESFEPASAHLMLATVSY